MLVNFYESDIQLQNYYVLRAKGKHKNSSNGSNIGLFDMSFQSGQSQRKFSTFEYTANFPAFVASVPAMRSKKP